MKKNAAVFGMIEIRGKREQLLEDIVLAMEEAVESRRAYRDKFTDFHRRLQQAGGNIRNMAVSRVISAGKGCTSTQDTLEESTPSKRWKERVSTGTMDDDEDDNRAPFMQNMADQNQVKLKRIIIADE